MDDTRPEQTGGLNERAGEPATAEPLGGTGGSSGGGTISGAGDPSGADADGPDGAPPLAAVGELAGRSGSIEAAEAAALGSADGTLADAAAARSGGNKAPTIADSLRSGAGRGDPGSGTPSGTGELGGGAPLGQHGGTGPEGTASPGGDSRK